MKKLFLLLLFICFFYRSFSQVTIKGDTNFHLIQWKEGIKLTWEDFMAEPDSTILYDAVSHFDIGVKMRQDTLDQHIVRPLVYFAFDRTKSWARNNETDILLQHEQLHFDIVELIARQLRKKLKELEEEKVVRPEDTYMLINMYRDKLSVTQNQYDLETRHSMLVDKQKEWTSKIEQEMAL